LAVAFKLWAIFSFIKCENRSQGQRWRSMVTKI